MATLAEALHLAVQHHQAGRLLPAEQIYRQILEVDPSNANALHLLGVAASQAGRHQEAEASIRQAIERDGSIADFHSNLGNVLQAQGRADEALACYRRAVELAPDYLAARNNLGMALRLRKQWDEAARVYQGTLQFHPGAATAHDGLGTLHLDREEYDAAQACYRRALELSPHNADVHNNLGTALFRSGQLEASLQCFRRAVELQPDHAQAHSHLGQVLHQLQQFEESRSCHERAVRLRPLQAEFHSDHGSALQQLGNYDAALASYSRAAELMPDLARARSNRSILRLLKGELLQGWPEYEWRWQANGLSGPRQFGRPQWQGEPLAGKTILLHAEQGLGDTLQFIRYAALVKQRGATTIVECQASLVALLKSAAGIDHLFPVGATFPEFDFHAPLLSLPGIFGTTLQTIPQQHPYLTADPQLVEIWRQKLSPIPGLKIGIAWQGSRAHKNDALRSAPLAEFEPLARCPGVTLISLQKGDGTEQIRQVAGRFAVLEFSTLESGGPLAESTDGFMDTSALMRNLDLVITVDTSVAHLAGALGVPVWVAIGFVPDWRWMLGRDDSPWYPSLRLFRQQSPRDWPGVFQRMAAALPSRSAPAVPRESIAISTSPPVTRKPAIADIAAALNSAVLHHRQGRLQPAEEIYRQILEVEPRNINALHLLGVASSQMGRQEEAESFIRRAIQIDARVADFHNNLGEVLKALGRHDAAVASYRRALELQPDYADAHNNLGFALQNQGQLEAALACYARALELNPEFADAHLNRSIAWLLSGNFARGWLEYEWRWRTAQFTTRQFSQPAWNGEPLAGKTLLLHAEQGLGDTIQFIRYVATIRQLGGRIVLECQRRLLPLLSGFPGVDQLIPEGAAVPHYDFHAPLLSLPRILRTDLATIPAPIPYLSADATLVERWKQTLAGLPGRKIAIAWQGNPAHKNDGLRSIPLRLFEPLARVPEVTLISLQKGPGAEQLRELKNQFPVHDLGPGLDEAVGAFRDTAAILKNVDLVIAADMSIVHLAGALGVPVWVVLPFVPDWRWLMHREDSPWYPTLRLFRQTRLGDWDDVFRRVAAAIAAQGPATAARTNVEQTTASRPIPAQHSAPVAPPKPVGGAPLGFGSLDEAMSIALQHHQAGRVAAAEDIYLRVTELAPQHAGAWHLLGVAAAQTGRLESAVAHYRRALEIAPDFADAHSNLANALKDQGQLEDAVAGYRRALELRPAFPEAHNNLGNALKEQGALERAVTSYRRAIEIRPDYADAHNNLGLALQDLGQMEAAMGSYRRALELAPDSAVTHYNQATCLQRAQRLDEALASYRRALTLHPGLLVAYINQGSVLQELGQFDAAIQSYREALALKGDYAEAYHNLGAAHQGKGELDTAIQSYRRALAIRPNYFEAHNALGTALHDVGRLDAALASYDRAVELQPEYPEAHLSRSIARLLTGDFSQGWPEYEWRWRNKGRTPRQFPQPPWSGEPLAGRTILLYTEQGLGDTIQFVRYAPLLAEQGARVILECQPALVPLLQGFPGISELVPHGAALPAFDVHAALLSLPRLLNTALETIPARVPYLAARPELQAEWQAALQHLPGFRVGIAWQGSLQHRGDRLRSIPLASFEPLADCPGVTLISLQKGPGAAQLAQAASRFAVHDLGPGFDEQRGAFLDTAAVMKNLDLVVTADTSIAHLAGALGVPVWVALPAGPDWRWLLDRDDTPWYPTMRLFRQTQAGNWQPVFERMAQALTGLQRK